MLIENLSQTEDRLTPRKTGKFVAQYADLVDIDYDAINQNAKKLLPVLKDQGFDASVYTTHECHPNPGASNAAQWVFLIDCLNFSFWTDSEEKFTILYNGQSYTGYFALCAAIKRAIDSNVPILDATFCSTVTLDDLEKIFESATKTKIPLLEKRLEVFHEFGNVLLTEYEGSFENLLRVCDHDAVKLSLLIAKQFPCFRDSAYYKGSNVTFLKRAQIVVADLYACFDGKGCGYFKNIADITTFADYRIPQCLVHLGILNYNTKLLDRLKEQLEPGCKEEVEIRGCTIHAVDVLVEAMQQFAREQSPKYDEVTLNAIVVDFFLWEYARNNKELIGKMPFHKVRSHLY